MKFTKAGLFLTAVLSAALFSSCAKEETTDSEQTQDKILAAWIRVYHPDATKSESGVYILDYEQGDGDAVGDSSYVFVHYTKFNLAGEVSSSNSLALNQKVGTYAITDYYGSDIWRVGQESIPEGLEEIISGMRVGGKARIAIPVGLSDVTYTTYNAFSSSSDDENFVYEFELDAVVEDIFQYQYDLLEAYSAKHYGGLDSSSLGYYFTKLSEDPTQDTIAEETTIKVWYIGKRLDGTVFDTNIEDSAKFYRIYDSENDYEELEATFYADSLESAENNETVAGFSYALSQLKYGDEVVTFFYSTLGYGAAGSSTSIGEYMPLMFYIKLDPEDD